MVSVTSRTEAEPPAAFDPAEGRLTAEESERAARDPQRPRYHFLPAPSWINDPKPFYWDGAYHVYFQYCPGIPYSANKHWGHAVSRDLAHWEELPIALSPTPGGPDQDGCWTGCVLEHEGKFHILYTAIPHLTRPRFDQVQSLATSEDLVHWEKYAGNPVIPASAKPEGFGNTFRDPQAWREDDGWYCVIGGNVVEGQNEFKAGAPFLYRSADLIHWEYLHPLCVGDVRATEPVWTGSAWECPQFLAFGEQHALVISAWDHHTFYTVYFTGVYKDHHFTPEVTRKLDYGDNYFYAPQACVDAAGRTVMWGWLQEGRSREVQRVAGWSGVMSLPRIVSMRSEGGLGFVPAPELQALRGRRQQLADVRLPPDSWYPLDPVRGDSLEIIADIAPGEAEMVGVAVRCSPDGAEQTLIFYDRMRGLLGVDASRSSLSDAAVRDVRSGPFDLAEGETLRLQIFVDRSAVEVFANGWACVAARVYPERLDSLGVALFARGGAATVLSLEAWEMGAIWDQGSTDTAD